MAIDLCRNDAFSIIARTRTAAGGFTFFLKGVEFSPDCRRQRPRSIALQRCINDFEPVNQINHFPPPVRPASCAAEMRTASKRASFVDQALSSPRIEHWACTVGLFGHSFAPGCSERLRCHERLAASEKRDATREFELATFRALNAVALDGAIRKLCVNRAHFRDCGLMSGVASGHDWKEPRIDRISNAKPLHRLPRRMPRRPSPLEIVAAKPAGHIDDLTDEIQASHFS